MSIVRGAGRTLASVGPLEWQDRDGAWHTVPPPLASRRTWGDTDAFLRDPAGPTLAWTPRADGLASTDLVLRRTPNPVPVTLLVLRVDPAAWTFRVWGRADWSRASVSLLATEAEVPVAVNAAYFTEDGPLGLVVSDGVRRSAPARHRAAHFLVRNGAPVVVNARRAALDGASQGFQGFPSIMTAGRVYAYIRDGGRGFDVRGVNRRSAACTTRSGHVVLLVTDTLTNGLSFSELATVLGGLGCRDAMAFDGGSSTAFVATLPGWRRDVQGLEPVPVILGLRPRQPADR